MNSKSIAVLGLLAVAASQALSFTYNLNQFRTGDVNNMGATWATVTIVDAGANAVDITLAHLVHSGGANAYIADLQLNIDPFVSGSISNRTPSNKFDSTTFSLNGINGIGGEKFDFEQQFKTSNSGGGINRLKQGESVSFRLTGTGLSASDFAAKALNGGNNSFAQAHFQGLDGGGSTKLGAVPEPGTMAALGLGLAALARKRRK